MKKPTLTKDQKELLINHIYMGQEEFDTLIADNAKYIQRHITAWKEDGIYLEHQYAEIYSTEKHKSFYIYAQGYLYRTDDITEVGLIMQAIKQENKIEAWEHREANKKNKIKKVA